MSKQDWIWVAIRIFGIYLLVMAVIAIPKIPRRIDDPLDDVRPAQHLRH